MVHVHVFHIYISVVKFFNVIYVWSNKQKKDVRFGSNEHIQM